MGYRSDVVILATESIAKRIIEMSKEASYIPDSIEKGTGVFYTNEKYECAKYACVGDKGPRTGYQTSYVIKWNNVKWYKDDPFVMMVNEFLSDFDDSHDSFEKCASFDSDGKVTGVDAFVFHEIGVYDVEDYTVIKSACAWDTSLISSGLMRSIDYEDAVMQTDEIEVSDIVSDTGEHL